MTRPLAVLRPEPGNAATAERIEALGLKVVRLPLFEVRVLAWDVPDPAVHDALIVTSANTLRFGGAGLTALQGLPVLAVGQATADAARAAGFEVMLTGDGDAARLLDLAATAGVSRALHLGGRERTRPDIARIAASIAVYASEPLPLPDPDAVYGTVALLHSGRAARRLGELVADRSRARIAAISRAAGDAAGPGWAATAIAATPDDAALIAAAATLAR